MFASKDIFQTASTGGYQISRSVRLRSSATAFFNRTPGSSSNRTTWTWSGWIKRGALGSLQFFFSANANAGSDTDHTDIRFSSSDTLQFINDASGLVTVNLNTTQVFRDSSAWYHIVVAVDTTQATASNRIKFYVNGSQITAFGTATYPSQNASLFVNNNINHRLGGYQPVSGPFDGYLTEINFIDGQALTPSSFGETNAITGVWQPKKYGGTYGTNGFYLNFSDNSTAAALGTDFSGNSNTWTVNNISVTAGVTYDSMLDAPLGAGGGERGNYCVLNPLDKNWWLAAVSTQATISNANLTASAGAADTKVASTISVLGGKYYAEVTVTSMEITNIIVSGYAPTTFEIAYINDGAKSVNRTQTSYGASYGVGDIIGIAVDASSNQVTFYKNNTSQGTITNTFIGSAIFIGAYLYNSNLSFNFGQRPFSYTPPTGFVALNTQNLPTPTISNGASYMAATTYTGTGAAQSISNAVNGVSFQPDFVWLKNRASAYSHLLYDSIRGTSLYLSSNTTGAEVSYALALTAFNSNGFSVGTDPAANESTKGIVAWQWNAGGSTVTNTSGTISAQVRANPTAGFSVVTYTGNGSTGTVGHGLGVAPSMMIFKQRSTVRDWIVYHITLGAGNRVFLNLTDASGASTANFNNTAPTSSVFSIGATTATNESSGTYVAYCFAAVAGYSAFGSYTGNGSTDGPFVYLGFRPRFVMLKRTDVANDWAILDTARNTFNVTTQVLFPNSSVVEGTQTTPMDILSNGFKVRNGADNYINASGGTYVYACFAENPFKISLAR